MSQSRADDLVVVPVVAEAAEIHMQEIETGKVRVALTTQAETVLARARLRGRRVEVERVTLDRMLPEGAPPPQSREEGDSLVIPVVEEVAVVVRRLVLREEVRLRFVTTETDFAEEVTLRRQRAEVEAQPPETGTQP